MRTRLPVQEVKVRSACLANGPIEPGSRVRPAAVSCWSCEREEAPLLYIIGQSSKFVGMGKASKNDKILDRMAKTRESRATGD